MADQLLEVNVLYRPRAAQRVLVLKKKYGDARLEAACARAVTVGDPSYRTIKGILIAGTETNPKPEPSGAAGAAAFPYGPRGSSPPSPRPRRRMSSTTTRSTVKLEKHLMSGMAPALRESLKSLRLTGALEPLMPVWPKPTAEGSGTGSSSSSAGTRSPDPRPVPSNDA
ncbi:hypothetical protein [Streptomyces sp. NPDC051577]|uniref:hypothetical protein n=1 Tax=Streptomyces sp. NPDC051577 TaxID=3155166 RepID=UPI003441D607